MQSDGEGLVLDVTKTMPINKMTDFPQLLYTKRSNFRHEKLTLVFIWLSCFWAVVKLELGNGVKTSNFEVWEFNLGYNG